MTSPTILVVGATGNTGQNTTKTLAKLLETSEAFSNYRILALTRDRSSPVAQNLAALPNVEVAEKNWPLIDASWLKEHQVVRAFIASHNEPTHFPEESGFLLACLQAGVEYVVRISTTHANVTSVNKAYYPRNHWAIESLLSSPEFEALQWTSLQPNVFHTFYLASAAQFIQSYRKTGKQELPLRLMASGDTLNAPIAADDVGAVAGHLLAVKDTAAHNRRKYVLQGPEDITGEDIVKMVEHEIGTKVEDVKFKDTRFLDAWVAGDKKTGHIIATIKHAPEVSWEGKTTANTTSKEVLEIAAPNGTAAEALKAMLEG